MWQKCEYNAGVRRVTFHEGELCWVVNKIRRKGVSLKLTHTWKGPGVIVQMHSYVTAEVQLSAHKSVNVQTNMLKACSHEPWPRWIQQALARMKARQHLAAQSPWS